MSEHRELPLRGPDDTPYPPYVTTADQQRRWDLSEAIARELFAEDGEASVWTATRSIYRLPIKTDD
jgi:hypothetical protein